MLSGQLTGRARAQSHANIRKKLLRSKSEDNKEMSKNATATSFRPKLQRLLQQGKIEFIMNTDPHTKADLYYTTHINELQKELASVKKSLGTMVMKSKSKEYNINILKNDIKKVERESGIIKNENFYSKNKLSSQRGDLEHKKNNLEIQVWKQKCYANMKQRLIKEEEFLRTRHDLRAVQYKNIKDEYAVLDKKYSDLNQLNKQLNYTLNTAKKISREQTSDKNQYIELFNQQMAEKDMLNDLKIQKNEKESEINGLATSVIEREELQKYMAIMFTHKLLSQIIKAKSQNLMKQYEKVQQAYMHIKSNTNIVELDKIVKRMESQDLQYEKLLKKVSSLEQQIISMEKKMDSQVEKERQILSMEGEVKRSKMQTYQGIEKDNYELLVLQKNKQIQRKRDDQILRKKIILWVEEYCNLYGIQIRQKEEDNFFSKLTLLAGALKKHK